MRIRSLFACLLWALFTYTLPASAGEWTQYSTPHFQLYSNASEAQAQDWVVSLEKLSYLIPRFGDSRVSGKFNVLVHSNYSLYNKIKPRAGVAAFVDVIDGDTYLMIGRDIRPREPALQKRYIFTLYSQHYLTWATANYSPWFSLGLAEILGQTQFDTERAIIGIDRRFLSNSQKPMSVESILLNNAASQDLSFYRSNAGALVHYLLFGSVNGYPQYIDALEAYLGADLPRTKEGFEQALGYPLAQLQADYTRYLQEPSLKAAAIKFPTPNTLFDKYLMSGDEVNQLMAKVLIKYNELGSAEKYLKKITKNSAQYHDINDQLQQRLAQQQRLAEAEKLLKKDPNNEENLTLVANGYITKANTAPSIGQRQADIKAAIELAQRALAINPHNFAMHHLLHGAYDSIGERDKAFFHIQEKQRLQPDNAATNMALAMRYLAKNDATNAQRYFDKACKIDSSECERSKTILQQNAERKAARTYQAGE